MMKEERKFPFSSVFRWHLSGMIPNEAGFPLVVELLNGKELVTEVIKDAEGLHVLRDVPVRMVVRWRIVEHTDEDLGTLHNTYEVLEAETWISTIGGNVDSLRRKLTSRRLWSRR
jgi:hypothetical protein